MTARADLAPFIRPIYLLHRWPPSATRPIYIACDDWDCRSRRCTSRPQGVDRITCARTPVHAAGNGSDSAPSGCSLLEREPQAHQCAAALDRGYLWISDRRLAHNNGHAGRSHRSSPIVVDWRRSVRRCIRPRGVFENRRDAHRHPRTAWRCRCDADALNARAYPQHVPRAPATHGRDCGLAQQLHGWQCGRSASRRSDARISGGAPYSS